VSNWSVTKLGIKEKPMNRINAIIKNKQHELHKSKSDDTKTGI
jgi:hypothetical protein